MNKLMAYLEQEATEKRYSKKKIYSLVRGEVELYLNNEINELDNLVTKFIGINHKSKFVITFCEYVKDIDVKELAIEVLVILLREHRPVTIQAMIGALYPKIVSDDMRFQVQCITNLLEIFSDSSFIDISQGTTFDEITCLNREEYLVSTNLFLDKNTRDTIDATMYLPPMISKPMHLTSNNQGANLTENSSVLLGKLKHNEHVSLDVLNIMNSTMMSLDEHMLEFEEESTKELSVDSQKNFDAMRAKSNEVYQHIIDTGNKFYFCNKFDSRGRSYTQGFHINLQSAEYKKSLISLYKKELITDDINT